MVNRAALWRPARIWCTGCWALMLCLGAGSGSLRSEERSAVSQKPGLPADVNAQAPKAWAEDDPKFRYLIEELMTERFESARLSIELAQARAEAVEIEEISRQQAALIEALIPVLATRDRQFATLRSETAALRQRLEAAQAELQLGHLQNSTLAAELAAARKVAESATIMALENLAVINAQIDLLGAAAGNVAVLERAKQPAQSLVAAQVAMLPAIPRQSLRLGATQ